MEKSNLSHMFTSRSREEWVKDTLLLLAVCLFSSLYFILNTHSASLHLVHTILDDYIPRIPVFAIPYLFYLPWLWVVIFYSWLKNKSFHKLAYSVIIIEAIAYCVYLTFQTYIPREPIISNDIFSWMLRFIHNYDQPYNALPSLHAALSTSIAVYFICRKSRWSLVSVLIAIVIVASTLLVKQHFVMDAVSGIILGAGVTLVVFKFLSFRDKPRKDLAKVKIVV